MSRCSRSWIRCMYNDRSRNNQSHSAQSMHTKPKGIAIINPRQMNAISRPQQAQLFLTWHAGPQFDRELDGLSVAAVVGSWRLKHQPKSLICLQEIWTSRDS